MSLQERIAAVIAAAWRPVYMPTSPVALSAAQAVLDMPEAQAWLDVDWDGEETLDVPTMIEQAEYLTIGNHTFQKIKE